MSFAARMQKTADKLLNKFDEREVKIVLRSAGARVFSEALGEYVIEPYSESDLTGVATTYNQSLVNGTTCLLYTSPSPRDGLLSRMPSSA